MALICSFAYSCIDEVPVHILLQRRERSCVGSFIVDGLLGVCTKATYAG